ncbi:sulfatase [Mammaliicoccus stepanovicii]|nr:sulfatase [Mammaliicoccus stepanovicii]
MKEILDKKTIYHESGLNVSYFLKYFIFACVIGLIVIFVKALLTKSITIERNQKRLGLVRGIVTFISIIFVIIGSFLYFGTEWFINFFGKLTPEQFIFNFNSPIKGTASGITGQIINGPVILLLGISVPFLIIMVLNFAVVRNGKTLFTDHIIKYVGWLLSLIIIVYGVQYSMEQLQLKKVYQAYYDDSNYIKDNYKAPKTTQITFPKKKKNLIHIYLESYENSYFDESSGGYMKKNLMPDLEKLYDEGVSFSNTTKRGGPYQTYGSSWSVASMVNMSTGLPLKIPMNGNGYGKSGYFLPGAVGIGDILNKEGYNQTVMFGADADFGGLTTFFTTHGNYKIYDVKHARKINKIPKDYKVWWGYEDKKLYQFAKEEITRLSKEGKPFNFTMENADTHFPDGYIEKDTPRPFDKQYSNVIFHSQKQVTDFVRWIQQQDFYDDTVIVLTGDHLSMDKKYFKDFNPKYHRSVTNLIINDKFKSQKLKTTNRHYAPFDMYPTILSSMGVDIKGSKLGLGTDLSSNEKTLIERDSLNKVNEELSRKSNYYNKEFVSERKVK